MNSEDWLAEIDVIVNNIVDEYIKLGKHIEAVETITDAEAVDLDILKAAMVIKLNKLETKIDDAF